MIVAACVVFALSLFLALGYWLYMSTIAPAPLPPQPQAGGPENETGVPGDVDSGIGDEPAKEDSEASGPEDEDGAGDRDGGKTGIKSNEVLEEVVSSVTENPVEDKPDINPVSQTNPIRKIKTNPFE